MVIPYNVYSILFRTTILGLINTDFESVVAGTDGSAKGFMTANQRFPPLVIPNRGLLYNIPAWEGPICTGVPSANVDFDFYL